MKYVILGASAAGVNAAYVLRMLDKAAEIIMISEDTRIYSKCILHYYMSGKKDADGLNFMPPDFIEKNQIEWKKGIKATAIDIENKTVDLSDGTKQDYDKLLIATGSHSFVPPIEGVQGADNVCCFHTLEECEKLMKLAKTAKHIVILGAGLVGVDVACGLLDQNKDITMVDMKEHMLAIQLDDEAASVYQNKFTQAGIKQYYNTSVASVEKNAHGLVENVVLKDGTKLPCDLLVIAAGVRANVGFLKDTGLELDKKGLVIDKESRTNIKDIYGAGDVTGKDLIWPVAVKEGVVAALNMAGKEGHMTDFFYGKSWMNFFDIPTLSYGVHELPDETYEQEVKKTMLKGYKKIIYKDKKVAGAILQGDLSYSGVLTVMIHDGIKLPDVKKKLLDYTGDDFLAPRS